MSADELERRLRAIGAERYHDRHPFHKLLHGGRLDSNRHGISYSFRHPLSL